jgi:hypothetical protein
MFWRVMELESFYCVVKQIVVGVLEKHRWWWWWWSSYMNNNEENCMKKKSPILKH